MNGNGTVVEVHKSEGAKDTLWWRLGKVEGASLHWQPNNVARDKGHRPSIALSDAGAMVEVHDANNNDLWYWTGQLKGESINFDKHGWYDHGYDPTVAVNRKGVVVEVHQSALVPSALWWWVGQLDGTTLRWTGHDRLKRDSGNHPSVAINSSGLVVEVHDSGNGKLWYWIGRVQGNGINWYGHAQYDSGVSPSVSLTDDNIVYEVHQSEGLAQTLWQRIGRLEGSEIKWLDWFWFGKGFGEALSRTTGREGLSWPYDDGVLPQIACNGRSAVQVHSSGIAGALYANASIVFNRASWMRDNLDKLGGKTLKQLVLPASHDAGMYLGSTKDALGVAGMGAVAGAGGIAALFFMWPVVAFSAAVFGAYTANCAKNDCSALILGKTQDLDVYGQLSYGVRYFDLRPRYTVGDEFRLYHTVNGPLLSDVLSDVRRFFDDGHRELVILKFSAYDRFNQEVFTEFCKLIQDKLGDLLWSATQPPLADTPLSDFLRNDHGTVIVVCDGDYEIPSGSGIWRYRDWQACKPGKGDLTVFDIYSNTTDFGTMAGSTASIEGKVNCNGMEHVSSLPRGQLPKFEAFNGKCLVELEVPCDLFLLSWTLTPTTGVWRASRPANAALVDSLADIGQTNDKGQPINWMNDQNQIINLLYTDYVEYSRSSDVAFVRNGLLT